MVKTAFCSLVCLYRVLHLCLSVAILLVNVSAHHYSTASSRVFDVDSFLITQTMRHPMNLPEANLAGRPDETVDKGIDWPSD